MVMVRQYSCKSFLFCHSECANMAFPYITVLRSRKAILIHTNKVHVDKMIYRDLYTDSRLSSLNRITIT